MTVDPVSDKPTITVDDTTIQTDEDTAVSLGLNIPSATDTTDQNGSASPGDNPEQRTYNS